MSLVERFYNMLMGKASLAVDNAGTAEEKIRLALHELEESAPAIKEAMAGPIAEAKRLQVKLSDQKAKVSELEQKVVKAKQSDNEEVSRIRAGQLLDARKELDSIQSRFDNANTQAQKAKERYDDWKKKYTDLQNQAMASLDENKRAEAQQKFNQAMQNIDTSSTGSTIAQAMEEISAKAAKADALYELDEDPAEAALKADAKASREAEIDELLKEFAPKAEEAAN